MKLIRVLDIVDFLEGEGYVQRVKVPEDMWIEGFSPISQTKERTLSWMKEQSLDWSKVHAAVIICNETMIPPEHTDIVFLPVRKPRLVFARVLERFAVKSPEPSISATAVIGQQVSIDKSATIGPYVIIGNNVSIGSNTVIHGNVSIYDNVSIGKGCIVHSGTVIGADGFGYEKDEDGILVKVPHIGGVLIEDEVEIGSNVSIDRGTIGNTVIRQNAKIDNLCHIAHNVVIGKNTIITAAAVFSGSVVVEDNCWIAPRSVIREGLVVGEGAMVGLGAVVVKSVPRGDVVFGVPAKTIKRYTAGT